MCHHDAPDYNELKLKQQHYLSNKNNLSVHTWAVVFHPQQHEVNQTLTWLVLDQPLSDLIGVSQGKNKMSLSPFLPDSIQAVLTDGWVQKAA